MNCQKCGSPLSQEDKFCKTCGTQVLTTEQNNNQAIMSQMPTGMIEQMNNIEPEVKETKPHPLTMNQTDLTLNAMSTSHNLNNINPMDPNYQNNINQMPMGNNQYLPVDIDNQNLNQPVMQPIDNQMSNMNQMNTQPGFNTMTNMAPINNMVPNNMTPMNNQIPQPMTPPPAMMNGMNQPLNIGPMGTITPAKNSSSKYILIGVAVAVVILVGLFLIGSNNKLDDGTDIGKTGEEENKIPTYNVNLSGFTFKVPQTYIYEVSNGYLMMTDESDSWIIRLSVQKASYETLKTNKAQLKPSAEKKGYKAEVAEVKTISGTELIKFNFEANGVKYNGAYTKLNSMYLTTVEGFNQDNTYDEALLSKAIEIVKTAEYTGQTANMEISIPDALVTIINE